MQKHLVVVGGGAAGFFCAINAANNNKDIKSDLYKLNACIDGFVGLSFNVTKQDAFFIEGGGNYGFLSIQKGTANGKNNTGAGVVTIGYTYTLPDKYYREGHK